MGQIRHAFASAKDDGSDASLVRPSNWNADHVGLALVRKTAASLISTDTALRNVYLADDPATPLNFAMAANEIWMFEAFFIVSGPVGADVKFAFDIPTGATIIWEGRSLPLTGVSPWNVVLGGVIEGDQGASNFGVIDVTTKSVIRISGMVVNGANAGPLQPMWAQAASDGTACTLYPNSWLKGTRVA